MTENDLRQKVADKARSWLWRKEADGSFREIIDVYNQIRPLPGDYRMTYKDPWCAAFVSAVGAACGLTSVILPECSCERMIALYRAAGRWQERDDYPAKVGDLVMYDWQDSGSGDCTGEADHVGLIVEVREGAFVVVEGNMSDAVGKRILEQNARYIRGFCCPDYGLEAVTPEARAGESLPEPAAEPAEQDEEPTPLPVLKEGDESEAVRNAQRLLIARGFRCGGAWSWVYQRELPDGEFGPKTDKAVRDFQDGEGLPVTGKIDGATWAALICN